MFAVWAYSFVSSIRRKPTSMNLACPRRRAQEYLKSPMPAVGIVVPTPWWWAIIGLDCGIINIGTAVDVEPDTTVAIIGGAAKPKDVRADDEAMRQVLIAEGRPGFYASQRPWSEKRATGAVVGICRVRRQVGDSDARGLWFDGPMGLVTGEPLMFAHPILSRAAHGAAPGDQVLILPNVDRECIHQALIERSHRG